MSRRNDPASWMWAEAYDLISQAERMHRQFFRLASSARAQAIWEPPVDVFEDEVEVVIIVALPGVASEHVEVRSEAGALIVRAERSSPFPGARHTVRQLEIPYGTFERRIPLPAMRLEAGQPELSHGCLIVRLRKIR